MDRRHFIAGAGAAALLTLTACGEDEDDDKKPAASGRNEGWEQRAAQLESYGVVWTKKEPGPWGDKADVHVPTLEDQGDRYTVSIYHPMGQEHWITTLYVRDQNNRVVWLKEFTPKDVTATSTFAKPPGVTEVTVYAFCNLHDHWKTEAIPLTPQR